MFQVNVVAYYNMYNCIVSMYSSIEEHITHVSFDSKSLVQKGKYNLFIKTTPRKITSFSILSAMLPRLYNTRYLCMKIKQFDNMLSLNDDVCTETSFAMFYFKDNIDKYVVFHTDEIQPNKITFTNPLSSLENLYIQWVDDKNNPVNFLVPRFKIHETVLYTNRKLGIITNVDIHHDRVLYHIQDCIDNTIHSVYESAISQFCINDNVFVNYNDKWVKGVYMEYPNKIFLTYSKVIVLI